MSSILNRSMHSNWFAQSLGSFIVTAACAASLASATGSAHAADDEVFQQFGGKAGVTKIANDLVDTVVADPRIAVYFKKVNLPRLKGLLAEQFCVLTGGPCTYSGDDMKTVHAGMDLKNSDFNALAEDLQIVMDKAGVPQSAQNKLVAKLAPMQRDVVTK